MTAAAQHPAPERALEGHPGSRSLTPQPDAAYDEIRHGVDLVRDAVAMIRGAAVHDVDAVDAILQSTQIPHHQIAAMLASFAAGFLARQGATGERLDRELNEINAAWADFLIDQAAAAGGRGRGANPWVGEVRHR
jgi:hypothetical protein